MSKKRNTAIIAKDIVNSSSDRVYLNTHLCQQWKELPVENETSWKTQMIPCHMVQRWENTGEEEL